MEKFVLPEITIERFDCVDVLTVSNPTESGEIWQGYDYEGSTEDGGVEATYGDDFW